MIELGVNIDHVATVREARRTYEPEPVWAAAAAELGGADCITVHLREDRRHIQDRDVRILRQTVSVKLNLELAVVGEILDLACELRPAQATLVPEKRAEVTTEGGLDVVGNFAAVEIAVGRLQQQGIAVSLFLDPDPQQLEAGFRLEPQAIELHTGQFAQAAGTQREHELRKLTEAAAMIRNATVGLHAGHGLNYQNVAAIATIAGMRELNIGHSIVARALFVGMENAVREMKQAILTAVQLASQAGFADPYQA